MEVGDLYLNHVRGSAYVFTYGQVCYKYPNGQKAYTTTPVNKLVANLREIKGNSNGRLRINEEGEIVVYRKRAEENVWEPRFAGKLNADLLFEDIYLNPNGLKPGLLWTGFCSHHGSTFTVAQGGRIQFVETTKRGLRETTERYVVRKFDSEILSRLRRIKGNGRFKVNEYGHVWAPVSSDNLAFQMRDRDFKKAFKSQFKHLPAKIKRTIRLYQRSTNMGDIYYTPIYLGKYDGSLPIDREEKPKLVYDPPDLELEYL